MTSPSDVPEPSAQALRSLVLAFAGTIPIMLVALAFVLPLEAEDVPPPTLLLALLALVGAAFVLSRQIGFRTPPLRHDQAQDAAATTRTALMRFQASTMVRLALAEAPFLVGVALSFVLSHGLWPALVTGLPSLLLMLWQAWPSRRVVGRFADALEADGIRSGLRESFG